MKILLVEDDEIIAQTLKTILRDLDYVVDYAVEGESGWEFVETYNYDLIMLDVVLPKLNGIEFCKQLRTAGIQTPVLLLTAQNSNDKKVIGLDAGADDYVVKPFEISELLARIRVLLRRRNSLTSPILEWGKLKLNSNTHEVTYDDQALPLTPKEYRLLELFLRSGDRVLTREIILDRLWDVEEAPSNNTVSAHIKDLRKKLKQVGANADWIETVYGVGYRLKPIKVEVSRQKSSVTLRQQTKKALTGVWQKFEGMHNQRIAILEEANNAWQENNLKGQLLQQAQQAAHKLAGGLGVFGFARGSALALEMEELLKLESPGSRARQFSRLLTELKNSLKPNFEAKFNAIAQNLPVILVVDDCPELVQQLITEMAEIKMRYQLATQPKALTKALVQKNLDAVICPFSLTNSTAKILDDFARIFANKLLSPVILFTDCNNENLLKIAHFGHHTLLQPASLNIPAIQEIICTLQKAQHKVSKVLAIDDDPQILTAIENLLSPLKVELTVLDNPLNFWQVITDLTPDLLILDVAMPHFTGVELCQLLRNDPHWRSLPILFFTVHNDLDTMHQILTAGGNDCISKTLFQSELVPKIFNHLNRSQLLTSLN